MIAATINLDRLSESEYKKILEVIEELIEDTDQGLYEIEYEEEY